MPGRLEQLQLAVREHKLLSESNDAPTAESTVDPLPSTAVKGRAFSYEAPYDQMTDPTIMPGDAGHISLRAIGDGQDA